MHGMLLENATQIARSIGRRVKLQKGKQCAAYYWRMQRRLRDALVEELKGGGKEKQMSIASQICFATKRTCCEKSAGGF